MKIVLTGAHGQLGSDCREILSKNHEVLAFHSRDLDITNAKNIEKILRANKPSFILNCAAYTNVDGSETEKEQAFAVNAKGVENLALLARKYGSKLIHISTDYVFDGKKTPPATYSEEDTTSPINHYGATKLAGERAILNHTQNYIILRTAWLYGIHGHNFLKKILKLATADSAKTLKVVNDQFGSPTWSYRLAQQIERLLESDAQGIYHATGEGYCSWYELALYFLKNMNITKTIVPCSSTEYPTRAQRPKNSILENRRLKLERLSVMKHWKEDIDEFVSLYFSRLMEEAKSNYNSN